MSLSLTCFFFEGRFVLGVFFGGQFVLRRLILCAGLLRLGCIRVGNPWVRSVIVARLIKHSRTVVYIN